MDVIVVEDLELQVEALDYDPISRTFRNLKPGDTVIGRRNNPEWLIGTVSERLWEKTKQTGWIYCNESNWYPFDAHECRKVLDFG